ncbi:MAG: hypothetical protein MUC63_03275 [Planctomycetes bacterium]|jgi:hypothetical protein|nr:hypothetical protein [Planctomycetota bacterium]
MEASRLDWPRVRVWKLSPRGLKTPLGRFWLDPRDGRVLVEAPDAVARRTLERIASEGVKDYDMRTFRASDGLRFLQALPGGLAFRPGLRAGRVEGPARAGKA